MAGGHHARGAIQDGAEVVLVAQLGLAGGDTHPNRQLQRPLRVHRGIDSGPRGREHRADAVTGVLEQPSVTAVDGFTQHLVVGRQCDTHRIRVGLPPPSRTLDIGEQEGDNPRRGYARSTHTIRRGEIRTRQLDLL